MVQTRAGGAGAGGYPGSPQSALPGATAEKGISASLTCLSFFKTRQDRDSPGGGPEGLHPSTETGAGSMPDWGNYDPSCHAAKGKKSRQNEMKNTKNPLCSFL